MRLTLFILLMPFYCALAQENNRVALIIANAKYDKAATGWSELGSDGDVPLIKSALVAQGFPEESITVVNDATRDETESAIQKYLIDKVDKGYVAFFHYSGHGQAIQDDDGDELDGFDEALVPIDAHSKFKDGEYQGENHVRDEDLGDWLNEARAKIGPTGNMLIVLDACHSGTGTRGLAPSRGTAEVFAEPGYKGNKTSPDETFGVTQEAEDLAPLVSFFGAAPNQLNYEYEIEKGKWVGSLSYAFSKAFTESQKGSSYRGLWDRIKLEMSAIAKRQNPQVEGNLDQNILGGAISGLPRYHLPRSWEDENYVVISGGQLHGLNPDSKVAFYPIDTKDIAGIEPKATGKVVYADFLTADIELDNPLSKNDALQSWVFVTERNFGDMRVKVKLDLKNDELVAVIKNEFDELPLIDVVDVQPDLIIEENNEFTRGEKLQIITNQDVVLFNGAYVDIDKTSKDILKTVLGYVQGGFLRNIEVENPDMDVSFEFLPHNIKKIGRREVPGDPIDIAERTDESGIFFLKEGDGFKLRIINNGLKRAYISILDIQPDNLINILVPPNNSTGADYAINAGDTVVLRDFFKIGRPYGTEVFKLMATAEPLDLSNIVTRGATTRGRSEMNPLQKLLDESFNDDEQLTRGGETTSIPPDQVNIYSKVFQIVPRE